MPRPLPAPDALLEQLLRIPSPTGREGAVGAFLADLLLEHFAFDLLDLQEVGPGRHNVIMVRGAPRVTFSSHMDTVPGGGPVAVDRRAVHGRGACDAKGQIAAQLCALETAIGRGLRDYACVYVVGEEVDSAGALAAAVHPALGSAYLVNGEPTDNRFVSRSRGVVDCVIRARGTAGHSSQASGQSALHKLVRDLAALLRADEGGLLVNIGMVESQGVANMSSPFAQARVCLRPGGGVDTALAVLRDTLRETEFELVGPAIAPFDFHVPADHRHDAALAPFCSDAPLFADRFDHIMMFGPGSIAHAHTEHEFVLTDDLGQAVARLAGLALSLAEEGA